RRASLTRPGADACPRERAVRRPAGDDREPVLLYRPIIAYLKCPHTRRSYLHRRHRERCVHRWRPVNGILVVDLCPAIGCAISLPCLTESVEEPIGEAELGERTLEPETVFPFPRKRARASHCDGPIRVSRHDVKEPSLGD